MESFNTCDLRNKEVINLCDGARLGCPSDFEFDPCDGKITALVIAGQGGFLGFGHCNDIVIPWEKIECVGEDAILVRISTRECTRGDGDKRRKKRSIW